MAGCVTGWDVSPDHVLRIAALTAFKPWPESACPLMTPDMLHKQRFPKKLAVLAGNITEDKLKALLNTSITCVIDANALNVSIQDFSLQLEHHAFNYSLGVLLTCPVIYACDIARIFVDALQRRLFFSRKRMEGIHLALHESIVNGLIHGNLQLSSNLRQSARDFIEYARLLDERLNNPAYAQKSMSLWAAWDEEKLEIKIRDEGTGYAAAPVIQQATPPLRSKSGRGLRIIAGTADSCTIDDFGREITLSFLLDEKEDAFHIADTITDEPPPAVHVETPDLSKCRVLIMEDNLSNQAVLARLLNVVGISHIEMAADGIEGLHKVLSYKPDLIILDITMPRMNGHEVLYHLKSTPETRSIPVLVQTASDTREMREKAFSSGATDFITKPVNPLEFFARVKVHLENRTLIRNLENQLGQIETELQSARRMQVSMLPGSDHIEEVRQHFHVDIAQYFSPSSTLGGDFWQMFPIRGSLLGIYLCDFSGHGVAAALNTFRLHGIIAQTDKKKIVSPAAFLQDLNTQLVDLLPRGQFSTFFFGIYDPEQNRFTYAGAGSPPPLLKSERKVKHLDTAGLPLGISKNATYTDQNIAFNPGDTLFLYSDALTESPNKDGLRLGNEGFRKLASPYFKEPTVQLALRGIMHDFFEFAPPPPPDDVTAVLIRAHQK